MSSSCKINMCKRKCCALCYCCNKNLCFNHLKEHRDLINIQLNPLANEVNTLQQTIIHDLYQQQQLYSHFTRRIDKLREDIRELNSTISDLLIEQDVTNEDIILLTLTIYHIKQQIDFIKQNKIFDNLPPFIPKKCLSMEQSKRNEFNLTALLSPFKTIVCKKPLGSAMASNNQQLLIDQRFSLHVFNQDLTFEKQYQWKHDLIYDICWSSTLNRFIFITNNKKVYLVNENLTSIQLIQLIEEHDWCSSTCSDKSLFLTTNGHASSIFEFNLLSSFELNQQWNSPTSCRKHEIIHKIVYNNEKLALVIEDSFSNMIHIEVRLSTTLDLIWSFQLDIKYNLFQPSIRCCALKYDEWLIIDSNNSHLFHISKYGKMKGSHVYNSSPWNAILFNSNIIAIRTENILNFHKIY